MAITDELRKEITAWASEKALKDAPSATSRLRRLNYDAWLQAQIWHYEKQAYLKIHDRESKK